MRPHIICHMISSIDGRILSDRWTQPVDGKARDDLVNRYYDIEKTFKADAWLVGRQTMQQHFVNAREPDTSGRRELPRHAHVSEAAKRRTGRLAVVVDPKGKLRYESDNADGDPIITILSEQVADTYLYELQATGISYLFAGEEGKDLGHAMNSLRSDFGVETLLVEGGGRINGAFLKAGLIDDISLMIYPGLDGLSGGTCVFEYEGEKDEEPAIGQSLRLTASETLEDGIIWARYEVERNHQP
ncbi:dihydrofolate reductase family protein [Gluconobacter cerinus]|uniref:dihydrofolate reductase family protein n=1 Tax=Gluconobacter cerinus TaxID=38307 RepID=UPI001B8D25E9|nr:dihydrofolate reductase family protein [Gluconobacter cerinus]MBS0995407.1 RibD family protein [Gluconobacter cerinus]